jgi:hypothetical protein
MAAQAQNGVSERRCLDGRPDRSIIEKKERLYKGLGKVPVRWVFFLFLPKKNIRLRVFIENS